MRGSSIDADREKPLADYVERLGTVLFHKKLGTYQEKAERVAAARALDLRRRVQAAGRRPITPREAGRLCKADLATDMVRELTELQGTMGGIYAREDGRPEEVWKAIYFHYLPVGVEATAPPTKEQLGKAAITWAAVSLADKLDTVVGMFAAGERPTGSRDPYGLRRAAQGIVAHPRRSAGADRPRSAADARRAGRRSRHRRRRRTRRSGRSWRDRVRFVLEQRGYDPRNVRAVTHAEITELSAAESRSASSRCCRSSRRPTEFKQLAVLVQARAQHREEPRRGGAGPAAAR